MSAEPMVLAEQVRELRLDELHLLRQFPPFSEIENLEQNADKVRVIGVFDKQGELAGYWMIFDAVHVEPLHLREDMRKRPGIARALWAKVRDVLIEHQVPLAFAVIGDGGLAENLPQAMRLGFQPIKGNLFYVKVEDALPVRRGGDNG